MRKSKVSMFRPVRILLGSLLLSAAATLTSSQGTPDFSGVWKLDNDRSQPKRNGDITLRIERHDPELTVETSISRNSASSRHGIQKYTTDGNVTVSTGADGDEFKTSVVWKDSSLFFSIEEQEDGRILQSKETWSVIEDGATLKRMRERPNGEKQTLFFRRLPLSCCDSKSGLIKAHDK
jgi:hypothetical protein